MFFDVSTDHYILIRMLPYMTSLEARLKIWITQMRHPSLPSLNLLSQETNLLSLFNPREVHRKRVICDFMRKKAVPSAFCYSIRVFHSQTYGWNCAVHESQAWKINIWDCQQSGHFMSLQILTPTIVKVIACIETLFIGRKHVEIWVISQTPDICRDHQG